MGVYVQKSNALYTLLVLGWALSTVPVEFFFCGLYLVKKVLWTHRRLQTFALAGAIGGERQKYAAN